MFATKVFPQGERHDLKGGHFMAVLHLTKENFESEVLKSDKKVLVDFWATWCGPCQMVSPIIEELGEELTDVKVCKVDVDKEPEISIQYNIMSIPTLIVFVNGEIANKTIGACTKDEILDFIMLMYDIVIIGAGTAGMSAAIYGVRSGKKVLLLEEKNYGGQIVNTPEVENYPGIIKTSGFEFATNLFNQAKSLGAEIKYEKAVEIKNNGVLKEVVTNKETYETKAIIIATGAKNRSLKLDKEKELIGSGVSYCATCDGMFFRGRDVAVVGGGNTALEDAMFLSNYCNKVYIIHRRDKLRGEEKIAKAISEKDNIEMVWNSNVVKLIGDDKVEGITVKNSVDGSEKDIQVSGLFIAVGQEPDNYDFEEVVELDDKGYVIAGEDCKTESKGIFTAGDCRTKNVRQLTTAASDGAVAAIGACEYIDSELDTKNTK